MSSRFDRSYPTALEERAFNDINEYFSEHVKLYPANHHSVERLERDMAKIALAANMAASKKSPTNPFAVDGANEWFRDVDLMPNVYLCHRPLTRGIEYAVVEHFPDSGRNEIWRRDANVVELLRSFVREQRNALEVWRADLASEIRDFLAESYPGQEMGRVINSFIHLLITAVPEQPTLLHDPAPNESARISPGQG